MTDEPEYEDDTALAAEYVLHLLEAGERQAFEQRMQDDPALRDEVRAWEEHFATLTDPVAPVNPPRRIRARLVAAIFPEQDEPEGVRGWLAWGAGFVLVSLIVLVLALPFFREQFGPEPAFRADLVAGDGSLELAAVIIPATHEIRLTRVAGGPRPGRVLELWLIAEGADAPVSLGVLEDAEVNSIIVPDDIAPGVRTGTLAISDEPPGGSPTGAPTGDILAVGAVTDI